MANWLDALSSGLTAATQGAGGYLQGQEQGRQQRLKEAQAAAALLRQKHQDEIADMLARANMNNLAFDNMRDVLKQGFHPAEQTGQQVTQDMAPTGGIGGGAMLPVNLPEAAGLLRGAQTKITVPAGAPGTPAQAMTLNPFETPEAQAERRDAAKQEELGKRLATQNTAKQKAYFGALKTQFPDQVQGMTGNENIDFGELYKTAAQTARDQATTERAIKIAQMGQPAVSSTWDAPDPTDPKKLVRMGVNKSGQTVVLGPSTRTQGSRSEMQRMQAERSIAGTQLMVAAHKEMEKGEAAMAANPALLKQFDQIKGDIMAHIPQGANINNLDVVEQTAATASLYTKNPVLANYIRNTMMYTFGQMETLPRTSDFRTRYEQQISGIRTGMPPDQISQVTRQRRAQIHIKAQTAISQSQDWGWEADPETVEFVGTRGAGAKGGGSYNLPNQRKP